MQYIDLHTHRPTGAPEVLEIENLDFTQPTKAGVSFFSAGLHPWHVQHTDLKEARHWLLEQVARPECLAIGETGLDKTTHTSWDRQVAAFQLCLQIASESGKPLILHCVRAYGEVLQILNRPPAPAQHLFHTVFHGFNKHPKTAGMLLGAGCFLSFGAALFRGNNHASEVLRHMPADRFLLETDDMNLDIKAVYARAAEIRGVIADHIVDQVWRNFNNLTSRK